MVSELISREALLAEYDRVHIGKPGKARKLIADAKAVDAVEVVHGRWIKLDPVEGVEFDISSCSVCGKITMSAKGKPNYCPNCGAKMDGDGNG